MEILIIVLIQIAVLALMVYIALWVLGKLGVVLPGMVVQIIWVIVILLALLNLWRAFGSQIPGF